MSKDREVEKFIKDEETMGKNPVRGDRPWLCPGCNALLGYLGQGGGEIRIKYKDLYVLVEGGRVTRLCRKCGRLNTIEDEDYEDFIRNKHEEK